MGFAALRASVLCALCTRLFRLINMQNGVLRSTGRYRWCTLTCDYLREFSKTFETVLMEYSGAGGKLIHEKKSEAKNLVTLPLLIYAKEKIYEKSQFGGKSVDQ